MSKKREIEEARERAATLRAGLPTSAIYNVNRKKGSRRVRPSDFLRDKKRKRMTVEQAARALNALSGRLNKRHEA